MSLIKKIINFFLRRKEKAAERALERKEKERPREAEREEKERPREIVIEDKSVKRREYQVVYKAKKPKKATVPISTGKKYRVVLRISGETDRGNPFSFVEVVETDSYDKKTIRRIVDLAMREGGKVKVFFHRKGRWKGKAVKSKKLIDKLRDKLREDKFPSDTFTFDSEEILYIKSVVVERVYLLQAQKTLEEFA